MPLRSIMHAITFHIVLHTAMHVNSAISAAKRHPLPSNVAVAIATRHAQLADLRAAQPALAMRASWDAWHQDGYCSKQRIGTSIMANPVQFML